MKTAIFLIISFLMFFMSCDKTVEINEVNIINDTIYYNNKRFTGILIERDTINNLLFQNEIKNGIMHGEQKVFKNGNLIFIGELRNGKLHGYSKLYHETGEIFSESYFENDMLQGESLTYYKNGNIQKIENFMNNDLYGVFLEYDSIGNVMKKGFFVEGKKDSLWTYYDATVNDSIPLYQIYYDDELLLDVTTLINLFELNDSTFNIDLNDSMIMNIKITNRHLVDYKLIKK